MKNYFVYILASQKNGTLYVGVTNDLCRRIYEHKHHVIHGFTSNYGVGQLVYYEDFVNINDAIYREKKIKGWKREWKIELIEKDNPKWKDLYLDLC